RLFTSKLHKTLLHSHLQVCERLGISEGAQTLFPYVAQKVTDVQRRVAFAIQVKIYKTKTRSGHDHLVCIEVPVDTAGFWLQSSCSEAVAGVQQPLDASRPLRLRARQGWQTFVQDAHVVGRGSAA